MAKRVVSSVDNINYLPDGILAHILSFLPTKDAVRTSFLSRRWRYLYTLVSNLDLELEPDYDDDDEDTQLDQLMNFVDRVLLFRKRPSILRFRLKCAHYDNQFNPSRIDGWIRALMWHRIQEFELDICESDFHLEVLPASLFTCETLVVLKLYLDWCYDSLKVPSKVCLPRLKVLHICAGFSFDGSDQNLFSSCPVLEEMVLDKCALMHPCFEFNIFIPTLKRLTIKSMTITKTTGATQVVINAPSLVYFSYSDSEFQSLVFVGVQSLHEAVIDFYFVCGRYNHSELYVAAAVDLLTRIKRIQSLQISTRTLWSLQDHKVPIPLWLNMTHLKIFETYWRANFTCLQYFLARSGCLETLIIEELPDEWVVHLWLVDITCLSFRLKTIEILSFKGEENCMKMVEYFLSTAKVLEKMTIHIKEGEAKQLQITKELLMLPRVSLRSRIIIV
ncbi:hypothetical protein SLE2022_395820 [Rubroshorea leprosula]